MAMSPADELCDYLYLSVRNLNREFQLEAGPGVTGAKSLRVLAMRTVSSATKLITKSGLGTQQLRELDGLVAEIELIVVPALLKAQSQPEGRATYLIKSVGDIVKSILARLSASSSKGVVTSTPALVAELAAGAGIGGAISTATKTVFISHDKTNVAVARMLREKLQAHSITTFVADDSISPGDIWRREIYKALQEADAVIGLISDAAVSSNWVIAEVGFSLFVEKRTFIAYFDLPREKLPPLVEPVQACDISSDHGKQKLVDAVVKYLNR